jgi:hypothetical protein
MEEITNKQKKQKRKRKERKISFACVIRIVIGVGA